MLKGTTVLATTVVVAAAAILPCLLTLPGQSKQIAASGQDAGRQWGSAKHWGAQANPANNKSTAGTRTQELIKHDDLLPGQNRTQAMRLEAETGHINPAEDAVVDKAIKQDRAREKTQSHRRTVRVKVAR